MRVLYFSHGYSTHDRRFLAKIASSRHEALFLRLDDDGTDRPTALPEKVTAVRWKGAGAAPTPQTCLEAVPRLAQLLSEVKPDAVHAGPIPTCAFMVALVGFRPLLSMSWGSDILVDAQENELARWCASFALQRSDVFVVDCDAVREAIRGLVSSDTTPFVQFPWGLELGRFPRVPFREPSDEIVVISTRSWAPIYGIDTLLDAFALAVVEEPRLRLVLIGEGPLATDIEKQITERRLSERVKRPGRVAEQDLGDFFRRADVYMSCARSDGTSISLLEAMAHGLPVVVTDAPGNREWVEPGTSGWLAPAGDAQAFAHALLDAARLEPARRLAVARHNRELVERRADWDENAQRLLLAFDALEEQAR